MQNVQTGKEKQEVYAKEYQRLKRALNEEFYLEAISIGYAVIEDRLVAFLHHAGIVSRQHDYLAINGAVSPFIHKLLGKENYEAVKIKDISVKVKIIQELLLLTEEKAIEIDNEVKISANTKRKLYLAQKGYMSVLQRQIAHTVDAVAVQEIIRELDPWRDERNQLIHALLNKNTKSSEEVRKTCAEKGKEFSRAIDDALVKPFKKNNRIRKQFNIQ